MPLIHHSTAPAIHSPLSSPSVTAGPAGPAVGLSEANARPCVPPKHTSNAASLRLLTSIIMSSLPFLLTPSCTRLRPSSHHFPRPFMYSLPPRHVQPYRAVLISICTCHLLIFIFNYVTRHARKAIKPVENTHPHACTSNIRCRGRRGASPARTGRTANRPSRQRIEPVKHPNAARVEHPDSQRSSGYLGRSRVYPLRDHRTRTTQP